MQNGILEFPTYGKIVESAQRAEQKGFQFYCDRRLACLTAVKTAPVKGP